VNQLIFTEEFCQPENLYPFTLTRKCQDIRLGILTIREKWERMTGFMSVDKNEDDYKALDKAVNPDSVGKNDICYMVHGNLLPTPALVKKMKRLKPGEFIVADGSSGIVFCFTRDLVKEKHQIRVSKAVEFDGEIKEIRYPWQIFQLNDWAIRQDFALLTHKRRSQAIPKSNKTVNPKNIFLEKGANVEHCILNASTGPIYIGKNAEIMEGSIIRGPFSLGENAVLKLGSKVYGATTLGPSCVGGGEIKNSVMFGYSNKAHDGYLGDAVIGEWCNLGAGTTNSNLKNNAGNVRVWTPGGQLNAGMKCGVLMGDYSRTAINTSINTGTVISVSCNVFGNGLTPKYIPAFSWGSEGVNRYGFDKALIDIEGWKKLKGHTVSDNEKSMLKYIFEKL
jgi:UDP-N-acetylglucosamine diphosphorylase / glucose-1-phosphate thymidylyltransferase / UDP-N-acetylgalactosamine diphosphorylase / glucosamine-1-phosphate N-acetyltransferase / galactosamine-1-phosphate N-acetyltransferase